MLSSVCVTLIRQIAQDGIVLQQIRQRLRVRDVVDGDDFDGPVAQRGAIMFLPMRPNPLIPTLTGMLPPENLRFPRTQTLSARNVHAEGVS